MASAAPGRKPYRKAPPQHRETRHGPTPASPPPAPRPDFSQVNRLTLNTLHPHPPTRHQAPPLSDSELDVSSLSSLELFVPPPPAFTNSAPRPTRTSRTTAVGTMASERLSFNPSSHLSSTPARTHLPKRRHHGQAQQAKATANATPPRGILKQPAPPGVELSYDTLRKSRSAELLDDGRHRAERRGPPSLQSLTPPSPGPAAWNWKMQVLDEKVRFSSFLDEITCRVLSPARLSQLGKLPENPRSPAHWHGRRPNTSHHAESADRTRRWDGWVASLRQADSPYEPPRKHRAGPDDINRGAERRKVTGGVRVAAPLSNPTLLSHIKVGERTHPPSRC